MDYLRADLSCGFLSSLFLSHTQQFRPDRSILSISSSHNNIHHKICTCNHQTIALLIMLAFMIKFFLFLAAAAFAVAGVIPGNGTLSAAFTPDQGGGFAPHCCTFSSLQGFHCQTVFAFLNITNWLDRKKKKILLWLTPNQNRHLQCRRARRPRRPSHRPVRRRHLLQGPPRYLDRPEPLPWQQRWSSRLAQRVSWFLFSPSIIITIPPIFLSRDLLTIFLTTTTAATRSPAVAALAVRATTSTPSGSSASARICWARGPSRR